MRLRALLVSLALIGSGTAACSDDPPPDAYQNPVPACDLMPDDTVANLVNQAGASHSVPPDVAALDSEVRSDCRWDFVDPAFKISVTLEVDRFPSRAAKTGVDQARYWMSGHGTVGIENAPPVATRVTPPPAQSAHSAADLGFEKAMVFTSRESSAVYAVDGNLGVAIRYSFQPATSAGGSDLPDDLDWQLQEAAFRLAKGFSATLRHYRR